MDKLNISCVNTTDMDCLNKIIISENTSFIAAIITAIVVLICLAWIINCIFVCHCSCKKKPIETSSYIMIRE